MSLKANIENEFVLFTLPRLLHVCNFLSARLYFARATEIVKRHIVCVESVASKRVLTSTLNSASMAEWSSVGYDYQDIPSTQFLLPGGC